MAKKIVKTLPFSIFLALSLYLFIPLFKNSAPMGVGDYEHFTLWHAIERTTILEDHQIPFWNPYIRGGMPLLAHPHSSFLYPTFPFILIFGPQRGAIVDAWLHFFIAQIGMYMLARFLRLRPMASIFSAVIFTFGSRLTHYVCQGWFLFLTAAWIPLILYCYLRSFKQSIYAYVMGFLLTMLILRGDIYHYAYMILFTGIYALGHLMFKRQILPLVRMAQGFLWSFLFGALKWLPMLAFLLANERQSPQSSNPLNVSLLKTALLDKSVIDHMSQYWEYAFYIGRLPLILALCALPFMFHRRYRFLLYSGLFFFIASFGDNIAVIFHVALFSTQAFHQALTLDGLIHSFPIFNSLQTICRMIVILGFILALMGGVFLSRLEFLFWKFPKMRMITPFGIALLILGIALDLIEHDSALMSRLIRMQTFPNRISAPFAHVRGNGDLYRNFLYNKGTLDGFDPIFPEYKVKALSQNDLNYRGELFLASGTGKAEILAFSPNAIDIRVIGEGEGSIVLNQNDFGGWDLIGKGALKPYHGLVSAHIDEPGEFTFRYRAEFFGHGLCISILSLIYLAIFAGKNACTTPLQYKNF